MCYYIGMNPITATLALQEEKNMAFKVKMLWPDGDADYLEDEYATEKEAEQAGQEELEAFWAGAEVLKLAGEDYLEPEGTDFAVEEA